MKKIILPALLLAGAMSSCSKDDVTEVLPPSDNLNGIGLDLATASTKGVEQTTATLRDACYVNLYYVDNLKGTATVGTNPITFDYVDASTGWVQVASDGTKLEADDEGTDFAYGTNALRWADITYPIQFYSMTWGGSVSGGSISSSDIGSDNDVALTVAANNAGAAEQSVVSEDISTHNDLLFAEKQIVDMPAAGKVTIAFDHALSKVDVRMSTKTSSDATATNGVYLLSTHLRNAVNYGTPTISGDAADNNQIAWVEGDRGVDYVIADNTVKTITETPGTKLYSDAYNSLIKTGPMSTEKTDENYALIIPQTVKAGNKLLDSFDNENYESSGVDGDHDPTYVKPGDWVSDQNEEVAGTTPSLEMVKDIMYVDVIYRMVGSDADKTRIIGWEKAQDLFAVYYEDANLYDDDVLGWLYGTQLGVKADANNVDGGANDKVYTQAELDALTSFIEITMNDEDKTIRIYDKTGYYDKPLYVRAGFGFTKETALQFATYYQLNLDFIGHGGYLLDDYYYDQTGERTDIPIPPAIIVPGEPIIPSEYSAIGLFINVNAWNGTIVNEGLNGSYK